MAVFTCIAFIGCQTNDTPITVDQGTNHKPNAPGNPVPADGSTGVGAFVTLQWTCTDPDAGDTVKFDVYASTSNPPGTLKVSNYNKTAFDLGLLPPEMTIYWKVVARDNGGLSTTGPVWTFKRGN
ncbi:MAG: hypothetical protein EHM58_01070 [Ignavibacteriae bacterium]|nr:MAG: hypothetical protein EHM58_01070 [Ignavibacteriota bacterium]